MGITPQNIPQTSNSYYYRLNQCLLGATNDTQGQIMMDLLKFWDYQPSALFITPLCRALGRGLCRVLHGGLHGGLCRAVVYLRGFPPVHAPTGQNFLNFIWLFGKFGKIIGWHPLHLWGILDPSCKVYIDIYVEISVKVYTEVYVKFMQSPTQKFMQRSTWRSTWRSMELQVGNG